jgi:hypothetical protein
MTRWKKVSIRTNQRFWDKYERYDRHLLRLSVEKLGSCFRKGKREGAL